jgi:hypothetical protein
MLPVEGGALRAVNSLTAECAADGDANRDSNGEPNREMAGSDSECCSQSRAQRNA